MVAPPLLRSLSRSLSRPLSRSLSRPLSCPLSLSPRLGRRRALRASRAALSRAVIGVGAALCLGGVLGPVAGGTPVAGTDAIRAGLPAPALETPMAPFLAVRLFDRPEAPWAAGHRGIDLAAAEGEDVTSPGDGVVTFAGNVVDRGVVTVNHGGGLLSSLEPVSASVAVGDRVHTGETVGVVTAEAGHCAPRTCVHWGVRLRGEYVNPLDVLSGYGRVVLLP